MVKNLSIKDRLLLMAILPQEGNFLTLKIIRNLQNDLSFSEIEIKNFSIKETDGGYTWDNTKDDSKEFNFGEKAYDIIVNSLKKLDKQNKLPITYFELFQDFIQED